VEDGNENEDENKDDGQEPQMVGQGEIVNTSADDVDLMVDNQPIILPAQCKEMCKDSLQHQPLAAGPWPLSREPHPGPHPPESHPLSRLHNVDLVTAQNPRPAVATLNDTDAARST
jgi:hypothetical protein